MPLERSFTANEPTYVEYLGFLHTEANGRQSRTNAIVTVPANSAIESGTVMAIITASGKYVPLDLAGADGSQTPAAILGRRVVNPTGAPVDVRSFVVDRNCEVEKNKLIWPAGATDNQKTAALKTLFGLGIKPLDP